MVVTHITDDYHLHTPFLVSLHSPCRIFKMLNIIKKKGCIFFFLLLRRSYLKYIVLSNSFISQYYWEEEKKDLSYLKHIFISHISAGCILGAALSLFLSFCTVTPLIVTITMTKSSTTLTQGVPQGSILGPLLFNTSTFIVVVVEDNPSRWDISFSRGSSRQNKSNTTHVLYIHSHKSSTSSHLAPPTHSLIQTKTHSV